MQIPLWIVCAFEKFEKLLNFYFLPILGFVFFIKYKYKKKKQTSARSRISQYGRSEEHTYPGTKNGKEREKHSENWEKPLNWKFTATSSEGTNAWIEEKSGDEVSVGKEAMNPPLSRSLERSHDRMYVCTYVRRSRWHAFDIGSHSSRRRQSGGWNDDVYPLVFASSCAHFSVGKHAANFQHGPTLNPSKRTGLRLFNAATSALRHPLMDWSSGALMLR